MSPFPERLPESHFFVSLSRGNRVRILAIRPWLFYGFWSVTAVILVLAAVFATYFFCHDNLILTLLERQSDMQSAYEDRIAMMRAEVDRATTRQMLNQDTVEVKVQQLLLRQMQLENRSKVVTSLAALAGWKDVVPTITSQQSGSQAILEIEKLNAKSNALTENSSMLPATNKNVTDSSLSFAPRDSSSLGGNTRSIPASLKPRPENELLPIRPSGGTEIQGIATPVHQQLDKISSDLDRIDGQQVKALFALEAPARQATTRLLAAINEAGLSVDRLDKYNEKNDAIGGPFIPVKLNPASSAFDQQVYSLQMLIATVDRLRKIVPNVPLRQPLPGALEISSGFGYRIDPFLGRPALHPGIDFKEEYGTAVRATAAGRVVTAAMTGGYGNMVEINHGNGLATRYGHLSQILVNEGDRIEVGTILGRIGSTGRSTGPHLHYEVRIEDESVDPSRFLNAGLHLNQGE